MKLRLDHFTAAQAGRAHANALSCAFYTRADGAQVYVPAPAGHVVRVADDVSELRLLTADVTNLGH
jgi:hypothetical protein